MQKIRLVFSIGFIVFWVLVFTPWDSSALPLAEYLEQVRSQNLSYEASQKQYQASGFLQKKSMLLTLPNFFASSRTGFQDQNQALMIFRYNTVKTENYSFGVEQNFSFGLNTKLYYNLNRNEYTGIKSPGLIVPLSYQTNPGIELTMPLWQDRFGKKISANRDLINFQNEANKLNAKQVSLTVLVEAEKVYWRMVTLRKVVNIANENMKQANLILQYVTKRARMNLGDKADVLQARALVESKRLELQQAKNNERITSRLFNKQRYLDSDVVKDELETIDYNALRQIVLPNNVLRNRYDVMAAEATSKAAVASAKIEEETNKPSLDLMGGYQFNGLETTKNTAISNSLQSNGVGGYVGLRFSVPVALGLQAQIREGARNSALAAKTNYKQKLFEQQNDWGNLVQNIADYKENLHLAILIEEAQKSKLDYEKNLLKQGRTSTYQVLLFEQDYDNSQIATVQTAYNLLSLLADKKLYQDN